MFHILFERNVQSPVETGGSDSFFFDGTYYRRFLSLGLEGCVGVDGAEDVEEN